MSNDYLSNTILQKYPYFSKFLQSWEIIGYSLPITMIHIYVDIYVCVSLCVFFCVCIYIYISPYFSKFLNSWEIFSSHDYAHTDIGDWGQPRRQALTFGPLFSSLNFNSCLSFLFFISPSPHHYWFYSLNVYLTNGFAYLVHL